MHIVAHTMIFFCRALAFFCDSLDDQFWHQKPIMQIREVDDGETLKKWRQVGHRNVVMVDEDQISFAEVRVAAMLSPAPPKIIVFRKFRRLMLLIPFIS